jgi:GT2 family glycosyltransferase
VLLEPTFLAQLMAGIGHDATIGIATGKLLRFDRTTLDSTGQFLRKNLSPLERGYGEPDTGQYEQSEYVFSSCGAVALYRRAMLEAINLDGEYFDESYSSYYEDLDIGWRAQLFGWKAYYVPSAVAYHYRGGGLVDFQQKSFWFERLPGVPNVSMTKKPVRLQRQIIKNRYLTLLKNASIQDIFRRFPAILKFELFLWGYVLCVKPVLFGVLLDMIKFLPSALKKRRYIQSSAKHQKLMLK